MLLAAGPGGAVRRLWRTALVILACLTALPAVAEDDRRVLTAGWDVWDPYQYVETRDGVELLTGLDVELARLVARKAGYVIRFERRPWARHLEELRSGARDLALGEPDTDGRSDFAAFSQPYRMQIDTLFVPAGAAGGYSFHDVDGLVAMLRTTGFRLGVVAGESYADPRIDACLADPAMASRIVQAANDFESFRNLVDGRIDGLIADRAVGETTAWRGGFGKETQAYPLALSIPLRFMFSKRSVAPETVAAFDRALTAVIASGDYDRLVRKYFLPVLVAQTLDSRWFFVLDIIGTVAFAISGVLIASREGYSVVGALILAALPAVGGGALRDLLVQREPIGVLVTPLYLCLVMATVAAGYVVGSLWLRLRPHLRHRRPASAALQRLAATLAGREVYRLLLQTCDAAGLATFTVIGVAVAVGTQADPLWLWGPILAMLTGAGGGILRDIVRRAGSIASLRSELYLEVALVWGLILSCYLLWRLPDLGHAELVPMIVVTVIGAFLTRMAAILLRLKSPLFVQIPGPEDLPPTATG